MYCFAKICCLCLEPEENILNLHVNNDTNGSNIDKIFTLFPFYNKIYQEMQLPQWLCEKCKENIDNFYIFYKNCLKSSKLLKLYYLKLNKYQNTDIKTEIIDEDLLKFIKTDNSEDEYDNFFKEEAIDIIKTELALDDILNNTVKSEFLTNDNEFIINQDLNDEIKILLNPEFSTDTNQNKCASPIKTIENSSQIESHNQINDDVQILINPDANQNKRTLDNYEISPNKKIKNSHQVEYVSCDNIGISNDLNTSLNNLNNIENFEISDKFKTSLNIPNRNEIIAQEPTNNSFASISDKLNTSKNIPNPNAISSYQNYVLMESKNNSTLASNEISKELNSSLNIPNLKEVTQENLVLMETTNDSSLTSNKESALSKIPLNHIVYNTFKYRDKNKKKLTPNVDKEPKNNTPIVLNEYMNVNKKKFSKKPIILRKPSKSVVSSPTPSVSSDINPEEPPKINLNDLTKNANQIFLLSIDENSSNVFLKPIEIQTKSNSEIIEIIESDSNHSDKTTPDIIPVCDSPDIPDNEILDNIDLTSSTNNLNNKSVDKISVSKNASIAIEISSFIDQIVAKCKKLNKENLSTDPNIEIYNLTFVSNLNGATEIISVHRDNELSKISVTRGANIDTIAISKIGESFVITHKSENIYCNAENRRKNLNHLITDLCNSLTTSNVDKTTTIDLTKEEKSTARKTQCRMCGIEFFEISQLSEHMNRHINARKRMCLVCDKTFENLLDLNRHIKIHFSSNFQQVVEIDPVVNRRNSDFNTDSSSSNDYDYNFQLSDDNVETVK